MRGTPTDEGTRPDGSASLRRYIAGTGVILTLLGAGFAWAPDPDAPSAHSDRAGASTKALSDGGIGAAEALRTVSSPLRSNTGSSAARGLTVDAWASGTGVDGLAPTVDPLSASAVMRQECDPYYAEMEPDPNPHRNFYFARAMYSSGGSGYYGRSWSTDFPKADRQFLYVMERTLGWDMHPCETPVGLDDPQLRRYPFVYLLEVGGMGLSDREVEAFREYLLSGGFAFVDDFWGPYEWANFEREIRRVLPEYEIVDLPQDHMIFRIVYPIEEVLQVPNRGNGRGGNPAYYGECRGPCTPSVRGIFDEEDRLMVLIAFNTDLGDAWEWAEDPYYPYDRSNYAFSLAFNAITYAMVY